ncbi:ABC transporter ATP-binding protein [Devosia albogilva]|uniref:ABC transporter ATP-binding protein n=1 Tax=Devosia albogilva TaxID=429726 RepID=A0ABW5QPV2_9HYPH
MSGLVVTRLSVHGGEQTIVDAATLSAPAGQITGLVGPNGAGKSTMMRAALGLGETVGGEVHFAGADLLAMGRRERAKICAFVEQTATTETRITVREVVGLGRLPHQPSWQAEPSEKDETIVEQALAAVELSAFADRVFNTLSGGEQQRVHLARALAQQPRLLVLDEPTSHLDMRAQRHMLELLRGRATAGLTVLMAIHDLNLAAGYCDRLVVMNYGRIVAEGAPEDVLTPALLRDVYGIEASVIAHPVTGKPLIAY